MKVRSLSLLLAFGLSVIARDAAAQASAQVTEQETLVNSVLVVEFECTAFGNFDFEGDGSEDYEGISVGDASEKGCMLVAPSGSSQYYTSGVDYYESETVYLPVTTSGTWQYYASFYLWFWSCGDNCVAGNGQTYTNEDPYGFIAYAGDPTQCPLNDICYGQYNGDDYLTDDYNMAYAYAGSAWGNTETFYVDALAIDISPSSDTLDAGEGVTLTAEASNTGNFIPFFQWTLESGPSGSGSGAVSGSDDQNYTYIAPAQITSGSSAVIKGCITNLTTTPVCETITIDLLAETISVNTPSPGALPADGVSTSSVSADVTNGPENLTLSWGDTAGATFSQVSGTTATYTAPQSTALFSTTNTATDTITATIQGSSPAISATTTLTLIQPATITSVSPATWTAGTTIPVTITGTGFAANSAVTFSNTSWGAIGVTTACAASSNTSIQCPSVSIPTNLSNFTGAQPVTVTVSTTTSGISTQATYSVNVTPIAYTYSITLAVASPSLTYGYSTSIIPTITCKVSSGAACAGNVSNPQEATFSLSSGPGSISPTGLAASTTYAASTMIGYPAQSAAVKACAPLATNVCVTANISDAATTITLNPSNLSSPLTGGRTQGFSATIQGPGADNQLVWTLTPSGASSGTMTSNTTSISGTPTSGTSSNTFTAPSTISTLTTVTLTACMAANTSICATPVAITLDPPPAFAVAAIEPSQATPLSLGHSMSYTVTVSPLYGFSGPVTLSASGLPAGVSASFSPASITTSGSATLTLTSAYSTSTYIGSSTVTVVGTDGGVASSASIPLTTQPLQYKGDCGVQ